MRGLERDFRSKMPALVQKELIRELNGPNRPPEIDKVLNEYATKIADELLHGKKRWPEWFKDCFIQQLMDAIGRELDSEFENKVKAEAQKRLDGMKADQWERYSADKAKSLGVNLRSLVNEIKGTRWFTYDRCGRRLAIEIDPTEIWELLAARTVTVVLTLTLPSPIKGEGDKVYFRGKSPLTNFVMSYIIFMRVVDPKR